MNPGDLIRKVPPLSHPVELTALFFMAAVGDYVTTQLCDYVYSLPYSSHMSTVWFLSLIYMILRAIYYLVCIYWLYSVAYYYRDDLQQARIKLANSSCKYWTFIVYEFLMLVIYVLVISSFKFDVTYWVCCHELGVAYSYSFPILVIKVAAVLLWAYYACCLVIAHALWISLGLVPLEASPEADK